MKTVLLDKRGVTAVEFALLAPVLFILIMGSIELGIMMFAKAQLEGTMRGAARMALTGDVVANGKDGEKIDAYVIQTAPIVGNAKVDITKEFYDRFDQVRQPEKKDTNSTNPPYCFEDVNGNQRWDKDPARTGLGGADDIINYKVTVKYPALFPLVTNLVTKSNSVELVAQTTLQNEPFAGGEDQQAKTCCVSAATGNPVTCT